VVYLKFRGSIEDRTQIRELEDEFSDISTISGWQYELITENFHTLSRKTKTDAWKHDELIAPDYSGDSRVLNSSEVFLEGITITIDKDYDPIGLSFDKTGKLATISMHMVNAPGLTDKISVKKYEFIYSPYIKMFTMDAEYHRKVVNILDYVRKKYIHDLEVIDTSLYWDNRDEEELKVRMWRSNQNKQTIL
jgi:hypothetical protein